MSSPSSTPSSDAPNLTLLNKRYRLLATIAAGGMATVYKAQDTLLNRLVAIKILRDRYASDPQFLQRFREEAQAAANLNHPNIVTIYDVGSDMLSGQRREYIVMELVEGQDLKQEIRGRTASGNSFTVEEAVNIARQICEGVGYAHRRGLVHCDLKPQNVLLTVEGWVKVADFGIARAYTSTVGNEPEDVVWGSPQYYAPEQAAGAPPTPASDVYSSGVMLYEMLTGKLPFDARDPVTLAQLHQTAQPPPLPTLNPNISLQLESIVLRALAKDPTQRYRDADHFARILAAYAQQGEEQTLTSLPPVRPPVQIPAQPQASVATGPSAPRATASISQPALVRRPTPPQAAPTQTVSGTESLQRNDQGGFDIGLWLLGAIALVCLLGLIPLYLLVYRAYTLPQTTQEPSASNTHPSGNSNSEATTVNTGQLAKVPSLVGKPLEDAKRELAALNLQIRVIEERSGGKDPQATVLEQRTQPDSQVQPGSTVDVIVSKPAELKEVPANLVGRVLDDPLRQSLSGIGWNLVVTESLNFAPEGTILELNPPGGSKLAVGDTLTITVSNGGEIDLNVNMSPIVLESVKLARDTYTPGQTIQFSVKWRATQPVGKDYKVGWYLLTPDGSTVLAQGNDREPRDNGLPAPTSLWNAGTVVDDTYTLRIPDTLAPGAYPLQIGMYADRGRLRVIDPGNTTAANDLVVLQIVRVQ